MEEGSEWTGNPCASQFAHHICIPSDHLPNDNLPPWGLMSVGVRHRDRRRVSARGDWPVAQAISNRLAEPSVSEDLQEEKNDEEESGHRDWRHHTAGL